MFGKNRTGVGKVRFASGSVTVQKFPYVLTDFQLSNICVLAFPATDL